MSLTNMCILQVSTSAIVIAAIVQYERHYNYSKSLLNVQQFFGNTTNTRKVCVTMYYYDNA